MIGVKIERTGCFKNLYAPFFWLFIEIYDVHEMFYCFIPRTFLLNPPPFLYNYFGQIISDTGTLRRIYV